MPVQGVGEGEEVKGEVEVRGAWRGTPHGAVYPEPWRTWTCLHAEEGEGGGDGGDGGGGRVEEVGGGEGASEVRLGGSPRVQAPG